MIAKAEHLCAAPNTFFADQFNNPDGAYGYASMAEQIWNQSHEDVDAFVQSVGTAHCITGVAATLREPNTGIQMLLLNLLNHLCCLEENPVPTKLKVSGLR